MPEMSFDLSAVVVNYRSAPEAERCVASLRQAFSREGVEGEILLVDCASGGEEAAALDRIPADQHLRLLENRGYSGGVNAGLARARAAKILLSNADVLYFPGAVSALLAAIEDPCVGAAAPLAVWDESGRLCLPPGYAPGFFRDLAQRLSGRWPALDGRRFAAFARETLRLWDRGGRTRHLSGAVLAVRREVFDRAGRFDERFPFEYEETEWEDRVRSAGLDLLFVPQARVRHLWARSVSRNPETERRRAVSEKLYRERRYGRLGRALLEAVPLVARSDSQTRLEEPFVSARPGAALAISPNPSRLPFAGADLTSDFRLPDEIAGTLSPGHWYFTIFRTGDGQPLGNLLWEKSA